MPSKKNIYSTVLTFFILLSIAIAGLYFVSRSYHHDQELRREHLARGYAYTKGVITSISYYKGHSVTVTYTVNNKLYVVTNGWQVNPLHLGEGDSLSLRYALDDPGLMVTEIENTP